ncbi:MAG: hypothetical protein RL481_603 [Pseudomonadota bacterium]|jgi:hypothetical protein
MWGLWLFPLLGLIFCGVLVIVIAIAVIKRPQKVATWLALGFAPFGCALLPIVTIVLIGAVGALFQKSDARLFEEIYGFVPEMREDQMLSDDFGVWSGRSIFMRLYPTPHDRKRILDVAPQISELTQDQFKTRGAIAGFGWWNIECEKPTIYDADGYRGWQTLTVYDCPERQLIFVIASQP